MRASDFTDDPRVCAIVDDVRRRRGGAAFSDLVDDEGHQYVDLVMEGGGVLGVALTGFTFVLEAIGIRFLSIGGASAGAVNAVLLAALGPPAEPKSGRAAELLAGAELEAFVDGGTDARGVVAALAEGAGPWRTGWHVLRNADDVLRRLGANPGVAFQRWLRSVLAAQGIATARQLGRRMGALPASLRARDGAHLGDDDVSCELAVVTADITTETKVDLPRMAGLYWHRPGNVSPADFVRASMSIPLFFEPLRLGDLPRGPEAEDRWRRLAGYDEEIPEECLLVDGGVMSNFPIDLFHRVGEVPRAPTLGIKLGSKGRRNRVGSAWSLLVAAFDAARHTLDYDFITRNPDYRHLVARVRTGPYHWLDFGMPPEARLDLFVRGAEAARELLDRFDWARYKEIRADLRAGRGDGPVGGL